MPYPAGSLGDSADASRDPVGRVRRRESARRQPSIVRNRLGQRARFALEVNEPIGHLPAAPGRIFFVQLVDAEPLARECDDAGSSAMSAHQPRRHDELPRDRHRVVHDGPRGAGYRGMIEVSAAGRAGTPDEVGNVGALLMGPDGAFITGSYALMDGGVTAACWFGDLASP
jgi:hypothetical protein